MALSRGQFKNLLVPGLNKILGDSYKQFNENGQHLDIFGSPQSTNRAYVENLMMATFGPAAEKTEAGAMMLDEGAQEMYKARVNIKTYAIRFNISKEAIDDNQYMDPAKTLTRAMARSHAERMQLEAAAVLNNATSSSYLGGDAKALAASDHPTKDGGTNSNLLTTAADFNEASLEDMIIQIQGWVNQRGLKIAANLKKLILPVNYTFIAARLDKSLGRVGTADNDANVHKGFAFVKQGYAINNFLTDPDGWAGITDIDNGLVFYQRQKLESFSEMNFETTNMQYGCTQRYGFGWFDPLGVIYTPGA